MESSVSNMQLASATVAYDVRLRAMHDIDACVVGDHSVNSDLPDSPKHQSGPLNLSLYIPSYFPENLNYNLPENLSENLSENLPQNLHDNPLDHSQNSPLSHPLPPFELAPRLPTCDSPVISQPCVSPESPPSPESPSSSSGLQVPYCQVYAIIDDSDSDDSDDSSTSPNPRCLDALDLGGNYVEVIGSRRRMRRSKVKLWRFTDDIALNV